MPANPNMFEVIEWFRNPMGLKERGGANSLGRLMTILKLKQTFKNAILVAHAIQLSGRYRNRARKLT